MKIKTILLILMICIQTMSIAYAADIETEIETSENNLNNYSYRYVVTKGRGPLVFQEMPRGKFMKDYNYNDGDEIFVNLFWFKDGYALAYENGKFGYVDASYINWMEIPQTALDAEDYLEGDVYLEYDVDRDGKEDFLSLIKQETTLYVYLNTKLTAEIDLYRGGWRYVIAPGDRSNVFLITVHGQYGANELRIWRYQKGTWVNAKLDGDVLGDYILDYADYYDHSDQLLQILVQPGKHNRELFDFNNEMSGFLVDYTIENGYVRLKSRYCESLDHPKCKATRDFTTAKEPDSNVNDGPVVKQGDIISVDGLYISEVDSAEDIHDPIVKISIDNTTAWINTRSLGEEGQYPIDESLLEQITPTLP